MHPTLQPSPLAHCGDFTRIRSIRAGVEAELSRMMPADRTRLAATVRSAIAPLINLVRASGASSAVQIAAAVDGRFLVAAPKSGIYNFNSRLTRQEAEIAGRGLRPGQYAVDTAMEVLKRRLRRGMRGDGGTGRVLPSVAALALACSGQGEDLRRSLLLWRSGIAILLAVENDDAAMFTFVLEAP